ncbi:MAG: hypothetical protein KatS3mg003_1313 [Candidatus Nitrosocaldaceae archaeon]|nr:MAG: hypothetical protein KatS3mg003_1313 [Candidatus Nitrosocaldaceae archaeon]
MPKEYINDQLDEDDTFSIFQKKIVNAPWWISYKLGIIPAAKLQDKIEDLAASIGMNKRWVHRFLEYVITQFTLKFKDKDYYGYHTLDHELEAAYISLLAAKNDPNMSYKDEFYLFIAALLHDMDPHKEGDKPHEVAIEQYIRSDPVINKLIHEGGLDVNIIIAMIHRTTYPFKGKNAEEAMERINKLLSNIENKEHYINLGWFLSVCERIAGYAIGDFKRSIELAIRNAHALNWHPSVINRESVKFFNSLFNDDQVMFERVINDLPKEVRDNFFANVSRFKEAWDKESKIRDAILSNKIRMYPNVEDIRNLDKNTLEQIIRLYNFLPLHLRFRASSPKKLSENMLLITLRTNDPNAPIVGYAKGGPLEQYKLRQKTIDENIGKYNTVYLEPMIVMPGYWDAGGGSMLRRLFISEAKRQGYQYLTSYNHRKVLERRIERGEPIEIVCRFDPDMLDYYRMDLKRFDPDMIKV